MSDLLLSVFTSNKPRLAPLVDREGAESTARDSTRGFDGNDAAPEVEIVIEVPRGSHLKRDWSGRVSFVSPLPCPFNYGCVPTHIGLEGDLLDALVLGPRLALGTRLRLRAWRAVTLTDRGMSDDKLVCSLSRPTDSQYRRVLRFFHFYARCKALINFVRCRPGRNACEGWTTSTQALARARPREAGWRGSSVRF
jgi:inorganic pyrophosphatase